MGRETTRITYPNGATRCFVLWGSECTSCGNATCGSQRCDECGSDAHTVPMWTEAR